MASAKPEKNTKKSFFYRAKKVKKSTGPQSNGNNGNNGNGQRSTHSIYPGDNYELYDNEEQTESVSQQEAKEATDRGPEEKAESLTAGVENKAEKRIVYTPEQLKWQTDYELNKKVIDPIFSFIRQKTGKNQQVGQKLLDACIEQQLSSYLINESGTNFAGMCLLYEECDLLEYALNKMCSTQLALPQILGIENFHAIFNKSLNINECFMLLAEKKTIPPQVILENVFLFAPSLLFREENVLFYLNWIARQNVEVSWCENFLQQCLRENNRPILAQASKLKFFHSVLQKILKEQNKSDITLWLNNQLNSAARSFTTKTVAQSGAQIENKKELSVKMSTAPSKIEAVLPNLPKLPTSLIRIEAAIPSEIAHLSKLEDKLKYLSSTETTTKTEVIVKKKILTKSSLNAS